MRQRGGDDRQIPRRYNGSGTFLPAVSSWARQIGRSSRTAWNASWARNALRRAKCLHPEVSIKARWLFQILVIGFLWLVVSRLTEIEKLARTLAQGRWEWVLVAALLQIVYYIAYAEVFRSAFDVVGVSAHLRQLLPLTFASLFLNVVAPAGGSGGAALFVDDARRRGQSAPRATVGTLLANIADFSGFLPVLLVGLAFLFYQHELKTYQIISAGILLVMIGAMTALLVLGIWKPSFFKSLLERIQRAVNGAARRFKRPNPLADVWAQRSATEFIEASVATAAHPDRLARTILISLSAYIADIASLYCIFLAFHQAVGFGMLIAAFSIGILFWIVSITPQGIGVVEGTMALVLASLGVPAERSAIIALAFRGLTFWLPLLIGFVLARRLQTFRGAPRAAADTSSIRIVSLLTAGMGIINILSAVTPSLTDRLHVLEAYSPFGVSTGGHLTIALSGFALLLLANGLWRRKQTAWLMTVAVLAISIPAHLIKGLDYEEAILAGALLLWLVQLRPHFHARSDPPSIRQGVAAVLAAFAFTLVYGIAGFYLLDRHFNVNFGFWDAARQTIVMFTQFYDPGLQPITSFGRYFADSIYVVGAMTAAYGMLMLIRPVLARRRATHAERAQARTIVEAHGHTSMARLTLLPDKLYHFSPGQSVIAYMVEDRIAVTLGDPIGPAEDASAIIHEFDEFCQRNDWRPAFYQVLPDYLDLYRAAGFACVCIGHEGIVDLAAFTLAGGENKGIRSAFNHMTKLGYRAELVHPPHPAELLDELRGVSTEWLTSMHGYEKRFSVGWFDDTYLNDCRIMLIRNPQGSVDAFANIITEFQADEITIDLMRHRQSAAHGHMDFLFASLFGWAQQNGYRSFNLGLSGLSGVGEKAGDPAIERTLHYVYEHVNQFYNFKGLHEFKQKFHPAWSPRYLVYPGAVSLPAVAIALIRADQGRGLIAA